MKNLTTKILFGLSIAILLTGCASRIPINNCITVPPYGFLGGLWHGLISPISFIGRLFDDSIAIYAVNNNGRWYDFGFVLGAGILFGGSSKASNRD